VLYGEDCPHEVGYGGKPSFYLTVPMIPFRRRDGVPSASLSLLTLAEFLASSNRMRDISYLEATLFFFLRAARRNVRVLFAPSRNISYCVCIIEPSPDFLLTILHWIFVSIEIGLQNYEIGMPWLQQVADALQFVALRMQPGGGAV
jgi:hypothetical protein